MQFDEFDKSTGHDTPIEDSERYVSYRLKDLWPVWQDDARCLGVGVNYYFGDADTKQQPTMSIKQVRQASKLCDVCPVFIDCLRWALETREEYGVWASTSGRVRRQIFSQIDQDLTTVDDVIERYRNGERYTYRDLTSPRRGDHHVVNPGARLRDAPAGQEPERDRPSAGLRNSC